MSSVGQVVGGIVGGVIGFFAGGNVMLGASIGMAIGGAIDPPPGPKIEGPRLSDTQQQTACYGAQISRIYSNCATFCNIFWIENNALKEVSKTESQSAKGGGGAETTTYSYYGTFAAGICSVPIGEAKTLGRIWLRGKLFYDPTDAALGAHFENGTAENYFTFYSGADDQLPDDRMQAALGIDSTPAYRGLCYIVFKDLPLEDYGNSIVATQVKVEVVSSPTFSAPSRIVHVPEGVFVKFNPSAGPFNPRIENSIFKCSRGIRAIEIAADGTLISDNGGGTSGSFLIGTLAGGSSVEFELTGFATGNFKVSGSTMLQKTGGTADEFQGAAVSLDGTRLYVLRYNGSTMYLDIHDFGLNLITSQPTTAFAYKNDIAYPYVQGADVAFCVESDNGVIWVADAYEYTDPVRLWQIAADGTTTWIDGIDPDTNLAGPYGTRIAMAAHDGLMYVASNGGSFSVYSRRTVVTANNATLGAIVSAECLSSGLLDASDIDVTLLTQEVRGYKVSNTSSIRSAIEPLRACWPFDAVPSGYKIKFLPRGSASVATVDSLELGVTDGNSSPGVQITQSREMATQLPRRVEVTYIDADREYDIGPPGIAERINTDAINVEQIELPIVLTADEGQAKAQTLLYLRWLERHDLSFVMPPPRLNLEVADVMTLTAPGATYLCRLTETTTLPDGRIEAKAKLASTTIYTLNAVAQVGGDVGQTLVYGGPSRVALLDIPCLTSAMDGYGMAVGMTGYYSGWTGGTLIKSDDNWQSWAALEGFTAPGTTIGTATNALSIGRSDIKDDSSILVAHLPNTALSSVTELQLWNGSNHFAVGAHGRWEIVAAQTIVEQSDGSFYLTNLMRGRFGTEWAIGLHAAGDAVVHLDPALVKFVSLPVSALGIQKNYKAVSKGEFISSATDLPFTWEGENLTPLAPVYLNGNRNSLTFAWTITWTRRTRLATEPFSGISAPLGESSEAYEVEIWNATYTTLKRTISGITSATTSYTAAQQVADFGANQSTLYLKVYQLSAVVGRGLPLVSSITRSVDPEALFAPAMVLGLHFNGTAGSTSFTDVKGHSIATNGNAQHVSDAAAFGALAGLFDGTGDFLRIPYSAEWDPAGGDYTVRGFITPSGVALRAIIGPHYFSTPNTYGWLFFYKADGAIGLMFRDSSSNYYECVSAAGVVQDGQRKHVAWSKQGNVYRVFYDGTKVAESTITATMYVHTSASLQVGRWDNDATTTRDFNGKMDDFQICKGLCGYTASYTPPLAQFADS